MKKQDRKRVLLLGCPIDCFSFEETVTQCIQWTGDSGIPRQVITINAQTLVMIHDDPKMKRAVDNAALVIADGISVMLAARVLSLPLRERVTGVDLMERLLKEGSRHAIRCFFLGAKADVVRQLAETVQQRNPGLVVAGFRDGYFGKSQEHDVIHEVRESRADILFVGMPTPFKETWCSENLGALGVPLVIGVGGTFDVLAGRTPRAPIWMQRSGLEWSWRFMMEPRKMWKRNIVYSSRFVSILLKELLSRL